MSYRHEFKKTGDVSDALMELADRPAERVNTRKFIETVFPSIRAARENNHTFEAIAQVFSARLGYPILASTISKHYKAILAESQHSKGTKEGLTIPQNVRSRDSAETIASSTSKRSLKRKSRTQSVRLDEAKSEVKAAPKVAPNTREKTTTGDFDVAHTSADPTAAVRSQESETTTPGKKRVLTNGQSRDVSHLFHTDYFTENDGEAR
ncbi:MAG: hypothetical protein AAFY57_18285 [Cyanobacteria bacterium J06642_2]